MDRTQEFIKDLFKLSERVVFIFNRHKDAIESDLALCEHYEHYFEQPNAVTINTLSRASRKLRSKFPERYERSESNKKVCLQKQKAIKKWNRI